MFLAQAVLRGKWWSGCVGAGVALGLAMLSKGPVALVQSVLPCARVWDSRRRNSATKVAPPLKAAIVVGVLLFVVIGFWWYGVVLATNAHVVGRWFSEVTRIGATETPPSPIFTYLGMIGYVTPWTVFLLVGFAVIVRQLRAREITADLLAALLLVVPLVIMSFAKDRQDRYALPMIPAAAIVTAIGVREHLSRWKSPDRTFRVVQTLHWTMLAIIAAIVPMLGATPLLKQADGSPWFSLKFATIEAALGAVLVITGIVRHRRKPGALVAMTFVTMLVMQAVIFKGYRTSTSGRSDLKPLADAMATTFPGATYFNAHPKGKRPPTDLGVYLNRTIRWIPDASQVQPTDHPLVLFMLQNKGDPEPDPPEQWHFVDKAKRDKDWWWAFVLPPI